MKFKNQKGIISLFVLFAMLILMVFVIGIYYYALENAKNQNMKNYEYKEIYSKNYQEINNIKYADPNEVIPIYNVGELNIAGTNNYLQIKNKIYECGREKSYVLKNDIIVDITERVKDKSISFNDYKLHSNTYLIDDASYDIYYYKDNTYWKLIYYKKYENGELAVKSGTYTEKEYSILNEIQFQNADYDFLMLWSDENNDLNEFSINNQRLSGTRVTDLSEIQVYSKNRSLLPNNGEFCVFVSVGETI